MKLLFKGSDYIKARGLSKIVTGKNSLKYIGFDILRINKGESFELSKESCELVVIIFEGICKVRAVKKKFEKIIKRSSVFSEDATAIYVPLNEAIMLKAVEYTEIGICYSQTNIEKELYIVEPENVKNRIVGKGNYKRIVKDIIYGKFDADKLLIGETMSNDGNWSSFPPHKHDRDVEGKETRFEEVYHFRIQPIQGIALQNIYTEDRKISEAIVVENCDTVIIPKGYHPVVGYSGYMIYYLWILGGLKRDKFISFEEETHSWIDSISSQDK